MDDFNPKQSPPLSGPKELARSVGGNALWDAIKVLVVVMMSLIITIFRWLQSASTIMVVAVIIAFWLISLLVFYLIEHHRDRTRNSDKSRMIVLPPGFKNTQRNAARRFIIVGVAFAISFAVAGLAFRTWIRHRAEPSNSNLLNGVTTLYGTNPVSLEACFGSDFNYFKHSFHGDLVTSGITQKITIQICFDFDAGSKFICYHIPPTYNTFTICKGLVNAHELAFKNEQGVLLSQKSPGDKQTLESKNLTFSGRIYIYYEYPMADSEIESLVALFRGNQLDPVFRGPDYLLNRRKENHLQELMQHK